MALTSSYFQMCLFITRHFTIAKCSFCQHDERTPVLLSFIDREERLMMAYIFLNGVRTRWLMKPLKVSFRHKLGHLYPEALCTHEAGRSVSKSAMLTLNVQSRVYVPEGAPLSLR